jgi:hypothetical protein
MKLNIKSFALTCSVLWGTGPFFLTWWFIAFDGATGEPTLIGKAYPRYTVSAIGSVIGSVYAFFDALIGGPYLRGSTTSWQVLPKRMPANLTPKPPRWSRANQF